MVLYSIYVTISISTGLYPNLDLWNANKLQLHNLVVQYMVLQFVRTLYTLLYCHCPFHLLIQSASHNMQTTFIGLPLCWSLYYFLISNQECLWFETFSSTIHFLIKFLCFIVIVSNFHLLQL